jgi:hypothetical protein
MNHIQGERRKVGLPSIRESLGLPDGLLKIKPKKSTYQSGRRDFNPRPLDPQARTPRLTRSEGVGQGASHLQ